MKKVLLILFILGFGIRVTFSKTMAPDTLYLKSSDIVFTMDTLYFGNKDSVVVINDSVRYFKTKNFPEAVELFQNYFESQIIKDTAKYLLQEDFSKANEYFEAYEGKIIRSINYKYVDIFEGNVNDTTVSAFSKIGIALNRGHQDTYKWILKQNVRFEENSELAPSLLSENERLLRNLPYIENARIYIRQDSLFKDSVDVIIVTKDNFPYGVEGSYSSIKKFSIEPYNRNFIGTGHGLSAAMFYNAEGDPAMGYGGAYEVNNISGSYISSKVEFQKTFDTELYRLELSKPFLTNDIMYGGGAEFYNLSTILVWKAYYEDSVSIQESPFANNVLDLWFSRSFFITPNNYSQYFNLSSRAYYNHFNSRPEILPDSNYQFHDEQLYLTSFSYNDINYYKTSRLFGYGATEDVPYGWGAASTLGFQKTTYFNRFYTGAKVGWYSAFNNFGYVSMLAQISSFFYKKVAEDIKVDLRLSYFSTFKNLGIWGIRHAVEPSFSTIAALRYLNYIDFGNQIRNLNQHSIYGQSNLVLRYEPFFYSPHSILGFKFSYSVFSDIGWISEEAYFKGDRELYSAFGIGIHLKNESLTLPNITLQASYYPKWENSWNEFRFSVIVRNRTLVNILRINKPDVY